MSIDNTSMMDFFPYDELREAQADSILDLYNRLDDRDFNLIQGACGSGKTLQSLTPILSLIKENREYERVLIFTSVKQQKKAFEDEIENINKNSKESVKAVSLSGKEDLCPYVEDGTIMRSYIQNKCTDLRDKTSMASMNDESALAKMQSYAKKGEDYAFDPGEIPENNDTEFCPFYAGFLERKRGVIGNVNFYKEDRIIRTEDMLEDGGKAGICPHSIMSEQVHNADVVIANYTHLLNEDIRNTILTGLVNERSFVIIDEAHNFLDRARSLLEKEITFSQVDSAMSELRKAKSYYEGAAATKKNYVKMVMDNHNINPKHVEKCIKFLKELKETLHKINSGESIVDIRNDSGNDKITEWIELSGYDNKIDSYNQIVEVCKVAMDRYMKNIGELPEELENGLEVFNFLSSLKDSKDIKYYKYINNTLNDQGETIMTSVRIYDCIPKDKIKNILDQFAGGALISATLSPMDVYKETHGLDDMKKRKVHTYDYPLPFPRENRETLCFPLDKYKYGNRGKPYDHNDNPNLNETRKEYLENIAMVLEQMKGRNTMIVMPSYLESEWVKDALKYETSIDVGRILVDESSSFRETNEVLEKFFDDEKDVLVTGSHGVLTEGIDYKNEKLDCSIIVGVPIVNINSPKQQAILRAYEEKFGDDNAFDYAFTIPATRLSRQAAGRVIRTFDDKGIRIFMDKRYSQQGWDSVNEFLSKQEREEIEEVESEKEFKEYYNRVFKS